MPVNIEKLKKELASMPIGKLSFECAKRKIKGFQRKTADQLKKMIIDHEIALLKSSQKIKKEFDEDDQVEEIEIDEDLDEEELEEFDEDEDEEIEIDEDLDEEELEEEKVEEKPKKKGAGKLKKKKNKVKEKSEKKHEKKLLGKKVKKPVKEKKTTPSNRGRKQADRKSNVEEHGSPYRKNTSSHVFFKLLKTGGTKETIIKKATSYMEKNDIKCNNVSARFDRIVASINNGDIGKYKVIKNEKGKFSLN